MWRITAPRLPGSGLGLQMTSRSHPADKRLVPSAVLKHVPGRSLRMYRRESWRSSASRSARACRADFCRLAKRQQLCNLQKRCAGLRDDKLCGGSSPYRQGGLDAALTIAGFRLLARGVP